MTEATPYKGPIAETLREFDVLAKRHEGIVEALRKIGYDEELSYLACPGPPNCGGHGAHYDSCPVAIARAALVAAREATR